MKKIALTLFATALASAAFSSAVLADSPAVRQLNSFETVSRFSTPQTVQPEAPVEPSKESAPKHSGHKHHGGKKHADAKKAAKKPEHKHAHKKHGHHKPKTDKQDTTPKQ